MDLLDEFGGKKPWSRDNYSYKINVDNIWNYILPMCGKESK
jgi:hypothetical protein